MVLPERKTLRARHRLPPGGRLGNSGAWPGSRAAGQPGSRADSGEAQPFTGSLPCSRTCVGSPVPQCHRVSPEQSPPHQPGQAPQPPVYCMLCSFCPGFGPPPRPLPSPLSVGVPSCSQGSTRHILLLHLPQCRRPSGAGPTFPAHCEPHCGS